MVCGTPPHSRNVHLPQGLSSAAWARRCHVVGEAERRQVRQLEQRSIDEQLIGEARRRIRVSSMTRRRLRP